MVLFVIASASWYISLPISAVFRPSPKTRRTINIFQRHQQDINDAEPHNRIFRFKNVIRSLWIPFRVL
ncbi:12405_t:CDS:2 [Gigaspora rosea]|nr:12405_t:CDS:2 [Gigaspora rosea]